jgi:hypothetical protein
MPIAVIKRRGKVIRRFRYTKHATPTRLKPWANAAKACAAEGKKVGTKSMGACIVAKAGRGKSRSRRKTRRSRR